MGQQLLTTRVSENFTWLTLKATSNLPARGIMGQNNYNQRTLRKGCNKTRREYLDGAEEEHQTSSSMAALTPLSSSAVKLCCKAPQPI